MKNNMWKKGLVFGIIMLFVVTGIIPNIVREVGASDPFIFKTRDNLPHPDFILKELNEAPILFFYRQSASSSDDIIKKRLENIFDEYDSGKYHNLSEDGTSNFPVKFGDSFFNFWHINIDTVLYEPNLTGGQILLDSYSIYDIQNLQGTPMLVFISISNDTGVIKPCYKTMYGSNDISKSTIIASIEDSIYLYNQDNPLYNSYNKNISFDGTLSASAELQLADGVSVVATYTVDATMSIPGDGGASGESKNCEINLDNGQISLTVSVNKWGIDQSGTAQQSLPIGTTMEIPIPNTGGIIKAPVSISATVSNIQGSSILSFDTNSVQFNSEGTKTFGVTISEDAQEGESFDISASVNLDLEVGVIADIPLVGQQSLSQETLPMSTMSPQLELTGVVKSQSIFDINLPFNLNEPLSILLILIIIVIIIVVIAAIAKSRKKPKKTDAPKQKRELQEIKDTNKGKIIVDKDTKSTMEFEEIVKKEKIHSDEIAKEHKKRPKFCPECGNKLGGDLKFCPECGKKI